MIVSLINRKGGCSKTSTVMHGAGVCGARGLRTLIVDLDPQASLSQGLFGPKWVEGLPKSRSVAALFDPKYDPQPEHLVYETRVPNVSIIPASNDLDVHNTPQPERSGVHGTDLTPFLNSLRDQYEAILLDCPPNLQLCSWAAMLASQFVVIPVVSEDYSAQGLIYVRKAIQAARTGGNPSLLLLGYLLTMYNRQLGVHRAYEKMLRQEYGDLVFATPMPLSAAFKEAIARRVPVSVSAPRSAAALAMNRIIEELLERAGAAREESHGQGR